MGLRTGKNGLSRSGLYFTFGTQTFQAAMSNATDPRRPDKIVRYSDPVIQGQLANGSLAAAANGANGQPNPGNPNADDLTPDYMNVLGMIFSMCALMMRMKWCAWVPSTALASPSPAPS